MEFLRYKPELFPQILAFNKKSFPLRKGVDKSFEWRFGQNPYGNVLEKGAFIFNREGNEILGQFLVMKNAFWFRGKKYGGVWGFDFIVDEKLRGQKKGKILAEAAISEENYCVFGVSKASEALHYKFGNKELGKAFRYIKPLGLSSAFYFLFNNKKFKREEVQYPETLSFNKQKAKRVFSPDELPEKPFWNAEVLEWDRSNTFLKWRFFSEKNKYALYYAEDSSFYFVVRKIRWKNLNCLFLVDYRYASEEVFPVICKLAVKAAYKTKSLALISVSSMETEQQFLKKNLNKSFGEPIQIITTCTEVFGAEKVAVTAADSDFDTFYGDNVW